jgi:glycosyltransferase involved in cell wall biosynthesis
MAFVYFAEALVLARELKRRGITRLHNHFANAGAIVGYLATGLLEIPWSFTMHGISETDYPAGLLLGKKIEAADFVACVSYFGRAQAMRLVSPDHWGKLHIVRCGLPLARLPEPTHREPNRIICVGRLSPEKGQAGLLEAFIAIAASSAEARLVFVGDGPEAADLRSRSHDLGIADKVTFAGRLGEQETLEQIGASGILVLPSFMEGLPIVLMEAMALGTIVIASRVAGIPELVEDGKSGLLFTPSNWDELADCIQRLLDDEELRKALAHKGQSAVSTEFDIKRSASRLQTLFSKGVPE